MSAPQSRTFPVNSIGIHGALKSYQWTTSEKCVSAWTPSGFGGSTYEARRPKTDPSGGGANAGSSEKLGSCVPQHGCVTTVSVPREIVMWTSIGPSMPLRYTCSDETGIWNVWGPGDIWMNWGPEKSVLDPVKKRSVTPVRKRALLSARSTYTPDSRTETGTLIESPSMIPSPS